MKMVEGVLNYSTINAAKQTVEIIDLNAILQTIENDLELIRYDKLPPFEGAYFLVYQLFLNLISNALKFSSPFRTPAITVTGRDVDGSVLQDVFNLRTTETFVEIRVEDNGIGFSSDSTQKIFQTFTRLHSHDQYEGTGLGLALVKRIVERHTGYIYAKGEEHMGAIFILLFPKVQNALVKTSFRKK